MWIEPKFREHSEWKTNLVKKSRIDSRKTVWQHAIGQSFGSTFWPILSSHELILLIGSECKRHLNALRPFGQLTWANTSNQLESPIKRVILLCLRHQPSCQSGANDYAYRLVFIWNQRKKLTLNMDSLNLKTSVTLGSVVWRDWTYT